MFEGGKSLFQDVLQQNLSEECYQMLLDAGASVIFLHPILNLEH